MYEWRNTNKLLNTLPSDSGTVQAPQPRSVGSAVLRPAGAGAPSDSILRRQATQGQPV